MGGLPGAVKQGLTMAEVFEARRQGKQVYETTRTGARRVFNPYRRMRRQLMQHHPRPSGRQWRKLRKARRRLEKLAQRGRR